MPTWFASEEDSAGDYSVLEVGMPRFDRDMPWEYTQPAKKTFSWSPGPVKDFSIWIDWLVKSACGDGNFNLGISATPLGEFEPELIAEFRRMGHWLEHYGESIYGTRGGPYIRTDWYGSTCKDNKIYLHIFKTDNGKLTIPPLPEKIVSSNLLAGGTVDVKQTDSGVTVSIAEYNIQPTDTIVVLEINGSAEKLEPIDERPVNMGTIVSASSVYQNKKEYAAEMASDGDMSTYWQAESGDMKGWLEYDLGRERTFSRAIIFEGKEQGQYNRLRHCQIQAKIDGQWKPFADAKTSEWGGDAWPLNVTDQQIRFDPVTARHVRLKILRTRDMPVIHEFKLYER